MKFIHHYSLTWFLNFQFYQRQHAFLKNLISAELPILGMQLKTIDFLSNTFLSIFFPVSLSLIMFFFPPLLPIWFHSEQCRCQLISLCLCHRAPSNSWRSAMPYEYQTARHSATSAEQSDAAQPEQSWCPQNSQTVLLGSVWHAAKSGSIQTHWWNPHCSPTSNKAACSEQSAKVPINITP